MAFLINKETTAQLKEGSIRNYPPQLAPSGVVVYLVQKRHLYSVPHFQHNPLVSLLQSGGAESDTQWLNVKLLRKSEAQMKISQGGLPIK